MEATNSADICAEITDNTFGADVDFSNTTSGLFDVEQFGILGDLS